MSATITTATTTAHAEAAQPPPPAGTVRKPKQVHTTVRYLHNTTDDPPEPVIIGGPDKPKQPPKIDVPVTITDVAGNEDAFTLWRNGFHFTKHASSLTYDDFLDEERVKQLYFPEMVRFLHDVLAKCPGPNPTRIEILHHVIRTGGGPGEDPEKNKLRGPVFGVHIDQTAADTATNARRWLGAAAADALLRRAARVQVLNAWRPLRGPVRRDALAVVDAPTLRAADVVAVPVVFPDHRFSQCEVSFRGAARHRWYYRSGMGVDDVVVFVQDDTTRRRGARGEAEEEEDVPRRVAHVAFRDPEADEDAQEARQSVELRALVFYDEDWVD